MVLAALGDTITEANMANVKAKYIVELANGPINEKAYDYLDSKELIILPDVIANAGGVIVSYLEWSQNLDGTRWSEEEVNRKLEEFMISAVNNMYRVSQEEKITLKEAAFAIAIERLLA